MLTNLLTTAQVVAQEEHHSIPMPPIAYMLIIFGLLLFFMFATVCFTNSWNRHPLKEEHPDVYRQHTNKHDHGEGKVVPGKNPPVHH